MRILVADDFFFLRTQVRKALGHYGHEDVDEAPNGAVAAEKLRAAIAEGNPYQLFFCDWNMPGMTGLRLLELCRSLEVYRRIPFVLVTAEADHESMARAFRAGASDYITKPFSSATLLPQIEKVLARFAT